MNPTLSDKTAYAVHGMPPSELADKIVALENLYQKERTERRLPGWLQNRKAEIKILRDMVHLLALAYARLQNSGLAENAQAASADNFIKTVGSPAQQRAFLMFVKEHFAQEARQMETGMTMLELAQQLLEKTL